MRAAWPTIALFASMAFAIPRDAVACFQAAPSYEQHQLDRAQLDDAVPPSPVSVAMAIDDPDNGGCTTPASKCETPTGRQLVIMIHASDDRTPPDKMGFRISVASGAVPFQIPPGDIRLVDDQLVFFLAKDADLDFELQIRAIDLNGNLGPASIVRVADASAEEGCATHHGGALSFGMIAFVLAIVLRRRR